jgi:hypothetical protein
MTVHERLAVVAVCLGIAVASGHGVAWADPAHSESSDSSSTESGSSTGSGPKHPDASEGDGASSGTEADSTKSATTQPHPRHPRHQPSQDAKTPDADAAAPDDDAKASQTPKTPKTPEAPETPETSQSDPVAAEPDSSTITTTKTPRRPGRAAKPTTKTAPENLDTAPGVASESPATATPPTKTAMAAATSTVTTDTVTTKAVTASTVTASTVTARAVATTPTPPGPLSPIANLIALPGRIINTLLQALDLTVSVGGPRSPLDFSPIDQALFAAFRRVEDVLGLRRPPAVQPVVATMTYTGPTTAVTPTVAQFLNASAAEYVLGGTPGGLVPFTVDGTAMTSTNILSGESAQVWVTPQKQIIIAYQGTTGGTNLLANPLIAISQIVTDALVILTNSTPQAFTDALTFQRQVQAAAAVQGYASGDIFLTGHSLGGWEAEYVAQRTGLGGIGFESPGINTVVPGNGADSNFVNVETYGDTAAYSATDLPGLQPFLPAYVPGGGSKPHYGSMVMIGDPTAAYPLMNASALLNTGLFGAAVFAVDVLGNFFEHHLPGMQAYNLGVSPDPGVVPWLGAPMGPVNPGYGDLTISQLKLAASQAGTLIRP